MVNVEFLFSFDCCVISFGSTVCDCSFLLERETVSHQPATLRTLYVSVIPCAMHLQNTICELVGILCGIGGLVRHGSGLSVLI